MSYSQAQQLNFNNYSNLLKLDYNVQANLEAERHLYETKSIEAQFKGNSSYSTSSDCAVTMPNGEKFNWNDLRRDFINEYVIVKDRVSSTVLIWIKDRDANRHVPISDTELKNRFREFVEDKMGWEFEFSEKEFDRESKKLIRQIPMLSQSDVKKLAETVLAFENGYFDIIAKVLIQFGVKIKFSTNFLCCTVSTLKLRIPTLSTLYSMICLTVTNL